MAERLQVTGLEALVKELKGPLFKDPNRELRQFSKLIAQDMLPQVRAAVAASGAHQARQLAATARVHSDRVPVVVVGKVNPKFASGFTRRGSDSKRRRGALALGVVAGPKGGQRRTSAHENYYGIPRRPDWGSVGRALHGPIMRKGEIAYLRFFMATLRAHGFDASA